MTIPWVESDTPLPDGSQALSGGLVAAGQDLSPARLAEAYRKGLFPWFSPGDPVLWWSPDPRMVLRCQDLRISQSLAKRIRQFDRAGVQCKAGTRAGAGAPIEGQSTTVAAPLRVTLNLAFEQLISECAQPGAPRIGLGAARAGQAWRAPAANSGRASTWITADILSVYTAWHHMGHVHSVETWIGERLAGGLYGVNIGGCFFGESMFSRAADASKIALAYLVRYLMAQGITWLDCQQDTPHLARMGARPIARSEFMQCLAARVNAPAPDWGQGRLRADGRLEPGPKAGSARSSGAASSGPIARVD